MKNRFWFTVGLAARLGSCGNNAPESAGKVQDPAPEQAPQNVPLASPLAKYAQARGMPVKESFGPDKQFRLVGDLVFHVEDQVVPQAGELLLGGSSRMQFKLMRTGFYTNTFLLASAEECWVQSRNKKFEDYDSLDLWQESILRWHALRFPWEWQDAEFGEFTLETELGTLTLEVNEKLLPSRISLRGSHVALSDWQTASNSAVLYPMHWDWTYEGGRRVESFHSVYDHSLFVDSAFTPQAGERDRTYLLDLGNRDAVSGELLDFLHTAWQSVGLGEWVDSSSGAPGQWYEHQGERRFVFEPGIESQVGAKVLEARDWLVWSTFQKVSAEEAQAYLASVLPQLQATADGALWSHISEQGRAGRSVFVLPVIRK